RQLATDDNRGSPNAYPAAILVGRVDQLAGVGLDRFVARRVEEFNDLPIFDNGMGNQNVLAKAPGNTLGDGGFTVAGWAVYEHAFAGADGRAQLGEHFGLDVNVGECLF